MTEYNSKLLAHGARFMAPMLWKRTKAFGISTFWLEKMHPCKKSTFSSTCQLVVRMIYFRHISKLSKTKMQHICIIILMSVLLLIFIAMLTNSTNSISIGHFTTRTQQTKSSRTMFTSIATPTTGKL